jgi:hypothetical protein
MQFSNALHRHLNQTKFSIINKFNVAHAFKNSDNTQIIAIIPVSTEKSIFKNQHHQFPPLPVKPGIH